MPDSRHAVGQSPQSFAVGGCGSRWGRTSRRRSPGQPVRRQRPPCANEVRGSRLGTVLLLQGIARLAGESPAPPNLLLPEQIPQNEEKVGRTLGKTPHVVGVPGLPEGNVEAQAIP